MHRYRLPTSSVHLRITRKPYVGEKYRRLNSEKKKKKIDKITKFVDQSYLGHPDMLGTIEEPLTVAIYIHASPRRGSPSCRWRVESPEKFDPGHVGRACRLSDHVHVTKVKDR